MENYEKKYKEAPEKACSLHRNYNEVSGLIDVREELEEIFPEIKKPEDERIREDMIAFLRNCVGEDIDSWIAWLEKQKEPEDKGEISDGYHTFNELYYYRMLYNAAFFNFLPKEWVHKSKRHHDGEECFGGGWFIVIANLPTGQISNHYELKDWGLFDIPEKEKADEWDGHTPQIAAERLFRYLLEYKIASISEEDEKNINDICSIIYESCDAEDASRLITWVKFLKDRVQPQPKQEWSEEDEKMFDAIMCSLDEDKLQRVWNLNEDDVRNWLKSFKEIVPNLKWSEKDGERLLKELKYLRLQSQWKPSDEQMEALKKVLKYFKMMNAEGETVDGLKELEEQLKKLREE